MQPIERPLLSAYWKSSLEKKIKSEIPSILIKIQLKCGVTSKNYITPENRIKILQQHILTRPQQQ